MRSCGISRTAFELVGRSIAQSRMQPVPVVDALQEIADTGGGIFQVAVFVAVDFFVL